MPARSRARRAARRWRDGFAPPVQHATGELCGAPFFVVLPHRLIDMPTALITGITGQDGSYLAELLLEKGYRVYGTVRRSSTSGGLQRIEHIRDKISVMYADLTDSSSLVNAVLKSNPDEVYNLAAQSHVRHSFDVPQYTVDTDATGVLSLLEAVRQYKPTARF